MANYVLAQSWARANVQDRLWYVETEGDFSDFVHNADYSFGDKVYLMDGGIFYIRGSEGWYVLGESNGYIADDDILEEVPSNDEDDSGSGK